MVGLRRVVVVAFAWTLVVLLGGCGGRSELVLGAAGAQGSGAQSNGGKGGTGGKGGSGNAGTGGRGGSPQGGTGASGTGGGGTGGGGTGGGGTSGRGGTSGSGGTFTGGTGGSAGSPSTCGPDWLLCDGTCVDPLTDETHCGATGDCEGVHAGLICASTRRCQEGECVNDDTALASLVVTPGRVLPPFEPSVHSYTVTVAQGTPSVSVTAAAKDPTATVLINGLPTNGPATVLLDSNGTAKIAVAVIAATGSARTTTVYVLPEVLGGETYVKASNTEANDHFGASVALDGETLVVGAPDEDGGLPALGADQVGGDQSDNSQSSAGAVYVFIRQSGVWTQQAYLKADNPDADDAFGSSVAISGDTLVIGAPGEDSAASGVNGDESDNSLDAPGAAYVFERVGGTWTRHAYLKSSHPAPRAGFGFAVAIDGATIVVGAPEEQGTNGSDAAGGAYVFTRETSGAWSQQGFINASLPQESGFFGSSVAVSLDRIAVGAPGERSNTRGSSATETGSGAPSSGAVYVFARNGSSWTQNAFVKASDAAPSAVFGASVALDGGRLVVGAPAKDIMLDVVPVVGAGGAYVFQLDQQNHWQEFSMLGASNPSRYDAFGTAVSVRGKLVAVGAPKESGSASGANGDASTANEPWSGAVYLFLPAADGYQQTDYLKASNSREDQLYGQSVALTSDLLAVGAVNEWSAATGVNGDGADGSAHAAGAAYVYDIVSQ